MPRRADNPHPRFASNTPEALEYLPVHEPWVNLRRTPRVAWSDSELAPVADEEAVPSSVVSRALSPAPEPAPVPAAEPAPPSLLARLAERVRMFFDGLFSALFSRWWGSAASPLLPVASPTTSPLLTPADPVSASPSLRPSSPPPPVGLSFILATALPTLSTGESANWPSTMASSAPINIVRPTPPCGSTWGTGKGY